VYHTGAGVMECCRAVTVTVTVTQTIHDCCARKNSQSHDFSDSYCVPKFSVSLKMLFATSVYMPKNYSGQVTGMRNMPNKGSLCVPSTVKTEAAEKLSPHQ